MGWRHRWPKRSRPEICSDEGLAHRPRWSLGQALVASAPEGVELVATSRGESLIWLIQRPAAASWKSSARIGAQCRGLHPRWIKPNLSLRWLRR